VEESAGQRRGEKGKDAFCSGGLTDDRDVGGVAAELGDVALDPLESGDLVEECEIIYWCCGGRFFLERGMGEETESAETIVDGDDYDSFCRERRAVVDVERPGAEDERSAVNPYEDGKFGRGFGARRPYIQVEAVFGDWAGIAAIGFGETGGLHAGIAELRGRTRRLPGLGELGFAPAEQAYGRGGVGNAFEGEDFTFEGALDGPQVGLDYRRLSGRRQADEEHEHDCVAGKSENGK